MSNALSPFRSLTGANSRLGFYTKETREDIPEIPGCYAWILPFWFYSDHLPKLMSSMASVLNYESKPRRQTQISFNWDSFELSISRTNTNNTGDNLVKAWEAILADNQAKEALQKTLLEASLLFPPLYIGMTNNLRKRYLQHVKNSDFNDRFTTCVNDLELKLSVSDLFFVCIETPKELRKFFGDAAGRENELIEQMLMRVCHPPFSIK